MPSEKILIVDDDPVYLRLTQILLSAKGYTVELAETGQFAIEVLRTYHPSLIILDYQLPDIDGLALARQLKANPETVDIPIVMLTAGAIGLDEKAARDAGCIGFIMKPIRAQTFAAQVGVFFEGSEPSAIPTAAALVLVVNDDPMESQVMQQRLTEAGFNAVAATDGAEGLDQARRLAPAAVVSDILMPRMDGFKLCTAIRQDVNLQHIPIVLTTSGSIQKNDELMAQSIGANAFVLRSSDMKDVVDAVRACLADGPSSARIDPELIESLRRYFLEEGERQTLRLIDQLISGLNRTSLRRLSHRWAGVAGTFGYPRISEVARELELIAQRGPVDENEVRSVLVQLSDLFMKAGHRYDE